MTTLTRELWLTAIGRDPRTRAVTHYHGFLRTDGRRELDGPQRWSQRQVLDAVAGGLPTFTATRDPATGAAATWHRGAQVYAYGDPASGFRLRTDANQTEEDNLGNLPEL